MVASRKFTVDFDDSKNLSTRRLHDTKWRHDADLWMSTLTNYRRQHPCKVVLDVSVSASIFFYCELVLAFAESFFQSLFLFGNTILGLGVVRPKVHEPRIPGSQSILNLRILLIFEISTLLGSLVVLRKLIDTSHQATTDSLAITFKILACHRLTSDRWATFKKS